MRRIYLRPEVIDVICEAIKIVYVFIEVKHFHLTSINETSYGGYIAYLHRSKIYLPSKDCHWQGYLSSQCV